MARPRKINLEGDITEMEDQYGAVKQMVRRISKTNYTTDAVDSVADVDKELDSWYQKGYKLVFVCSLGEEPESVNMFYVLAKE